jgi:hypothetical protein
MSEVGRDQASTTDLRFCGILLPQISEILSIGAARHDLPA